MLRSQAWLALTPTARAAYVEVLSLYNGVNNGQLAMAARSLAGRLRCSKDTAARVLRELDDMGFIRAMMIGSYQLKNRKASEYRLTAFRCDVSNTPPSKEFLFWQTAQSAKKDRAV
jgi:hypothetical protein